jgi:superfamily II DNA helicase RecQ
MQTTHALRTCFGFNSLLEQRHTLVVMPTRAGKLLIFQFAASQLPGSSRQSLFLQALLSSPQVQSWLC